MNSGLPEGSYKVVFYVRESSLNDPQIDALENQIQWCCDQLNKHPEWHLAHDIFIEKGKSGTNTEKRDIFNAMIAFADTGLCDLIVVREISRFGRNTLDVIDNVRKLKNVGIHVFFVHENLYTGSIDGEIMLGLMASIAQDESRRISSRLLSGHTISMKNGVIYGNGNILGYDKTDKGYTINPVQAQTVKKIFALYIDGFGITKIKHILESENFLTATGKAEWDVSVISRILKNPTYIGVSVYRKTIVKDYLSHKRVKNTDKSKVIEVENTHTPIISKEDFLAVQNIFLKRTKANKNKLSVQEKNIWTSLLVCEYCGCRFVKDSGSKNRSEHTKGFVCRKKKNSSKEKKCSSMYLSCWKLYMIAEFVFRRLEEKHPKIICNKQGKKKPALSMKEFNKQMTELINMRADGIINKETFLSKKSEIELLLKPSTITDSFLFETNSFGFISDQTILSFTKNIFIEKEKIKYFLKSSSKEKQKLIDSFTIKKIMAQEFITRNNSLRIVNNWKNIKIQIYF